MRMLNLTPSQRDGGLSDKHTVQPRLNKKGSEGQQFSDINRDIRREAESTGPARVSSIAVSEWEIFSGNDRHTFRIDHFYL